MYLGGTLGTCKQLPTHEAPPMAMALYAAGFNAWNQLYFGEDSSCNDPEDIFTFAKVLTDNALERPYAGLHYTLGTQHHHPSPPPLLLRVLFPQNMFQQHFTCRLSALS